MARLDQFTQPATPRDQERPSTLHVSGRPPKGWRTVAELRAELRFPSDSACRAWLRRQGIASVRRGRVILVDALDVDRALRS